MQIDLQQEYFGNSIREYLFVLGALIVVWVILQLVKKWVLSMIRKLTSKTKNNYDDVLVSALEKFFIPYLYLAINFYIIRQLNLSVRLDRILDVALTIITVIFAARLINHAIHYSIQQYMERRDEGPARMKQLSGVLLVIKVIVWSIGLIFFLDNVGYDVTTVIAGLGVGGIAIALAAQNILGDLFSYFVIFFDKPFEIGDFIVMGDKMGTVEKIGIKTSHVRSISGEQLVMPNAELVKSVIHNFKRLEKRRVIFKLGVSYSTSAENLALIPKIISDAILANEKTMVDRSHLQGFGDSSINFETIYFVESAEYNVYMDINQAVCMQVLQQFRQLGIEIAYPTRTLFIENSSVPEVGKSNQNSLISGLNDPNFQEKENPES